MMKQYVIFLAWYTHRTMVMKNWHNILPSANVKQKEERKMLLTLCGCINVHHALCKINAICSGQCLSSRRMIPIFLWNTRKAKSTW